MTLKLNMPFQQLEFPLIKEGIWNDNLKKNYSYKSYWMDSSVTEVQVEVTEFSNLVTYAYIVEGQLII